MIAAWMLYCNVIAGLLGGAAHVAERGLLSARLPVRWVWIAIFGASLLAAPVGWLVSARERAAVDSGAPVPVSTRPRDSAGFESASGAAGMWERAGGASDRGASAMAPVGGESGTPIAPGLPAGSLDTASRLPTMSAAGERVQPFRATVGRAVTRASSVPLLDLPLLALWALGSFVLLTRLMASRVALDRRRARWRRERMSGVDVLVSVEEGPAVVGMWRAGIVLPEWAVRSAEETLHLVLLHEREHLRARDHLVMPLAALGLILLPWNLALWWQARRLKHAIELDCDARVLRHGVAVKPYGRLLLEVASRRSGGFVPGTAFSEGSTRLERRIRALVPGRRKGWRAYLCGCALASLSGLGLALSVPRPVMTAPAASLSGQVVTAIPVSGPPSPPESAGGLGLDEEVEDAPPLALPAVREEVRADSPGRSDNVHRADSAGIGIIQTLTPPWSEGGAWTVDPEPVLSIGEVEGEATVRFTGIAGAQRLRDGGVVVADSATRELRYFDPAGSFLGAVGGIGDGPDRFNHSLHQIWSCGEADIYAYDLWDRRVSVWSPDGDFVRQVDLFEPGSGIPVPPRSWGHGGIPVNAARGPYRSVCSPGGEFLVAGWGAWENPGRSGAYVQRAPVWVLDPDGRVALELGEHFQSDRIYIRNQETGGGSTGPHPFGRQLRLAMGRDRIYLGTSERLEVAVYDRDGRLISFLRGPPEDLTMDPELVSRAVGADPDSPTALLLVRAEAQDLPLPPGLPAYVDMKLDPDGYLWVQRFQPPGEPVSRWGVFAPDGVFLGHVEMPPGLVVQEIGSDWVLGVHRDEEGTERVRVHPVTGR